MLRVEELTKKFTSHILDGKEIVGFNPVSFQVPAGRALGLAGGSGYGKSSVLKCIYRTYTASSGKIFYDSGTMGTVELSGLPENDVLALRRREIGYVTQFLSVLPRVSAMEVVAEPMINAGIAVAEAHAAAGSLMRRLRIDERLHDAYPCTFSGGEKQRVNLARAVIRPPRLMLLDEPTASLDPASMTVVLEILSELKANGTTMIAVFHDRAIMQSITDAVFDMPSKESNS